MYNYITHVHVYIGMYICTIGELYGSSEGLLGGKFSDLCLQSLIAFHLCLKLRGVRASLLELLQYIFPLQVVEPLVLVIALQSLRNSLHHTRPSHTHTSYT